MNEETARQLVRDKFGVPCETILDIFADLVIAENRCQNLISPSTVDTIWSRHILDAAQLVPLDKGNSGLWLDIGTGAGFPGMVTGLLTGRPTLLVEPRKRRVEFLRMAIATMKATNMEVVQGSVESMAGQHVATTISARAVAPLSILFRLGLGVSAPKTVWILPKGRSAQSEVDDAHKAWHGVFHVEQSITQPESAIVVATGVRPK